MSAELETRRKAKAPAPAPTSKVPPLDLYRLALLSIARFAVGKQGTAEDHRYVMDQSDEIVASLAGPGASPLVRLLAQRVALAMTEASCLDSMYCGTAEALDVADYRHRCRDRAHRRLMQACSTYDRVTRAAGLQVNILQQVNQTTGPAPD